MGSSDADVPVKALVPAIPVNEPLFSIRDYVLAARDKNIARNWPFPENYLQTLLMHGVSKVLPPFESPKSVKDILYRKEEKSGIHLTRKKCVGLDRGKEIIAVNCNISTLNINPRSNEEMDQQCLVAVASCSKRLNSNEPEENSICVKDMESDIGSVQNHRVGFNRREEIIEVNGDISVTSNSNLKSSKDENSDCVKDDKSGEVTRAGLNCKEIIEVNGGGSTSSSNPRSDIEDNSSCVKDMNDHVSAKKCLVGFNRRQKTFKVNGVVRATSNSNLLSNKDETSDSIKDDKSDSGAVTCLGLDCKEKTEANVSVSASNSNPRSNEEENSNCVKDDKSDTGADTCLGWLDCKEIVEANGGVSTSDSNPRSIKEQKSNCVRDDKSDTGAINFVGVDRDEEMVEVDGNESISNSSQSSSEEENSDSDSVQTNSEVFNHKEETIEVNSKVRCVSNLYPKSSEEVDEQCLKAAASCSKRLNSPWKKRKRKVKKRLVADVVADAKPYTLEELDRINGSNWAIDQHVIYRRILSRNREDEPKETTAINAIRGTRSAERFQKTKKHRKGNSTAENNSGVVRRPAVAVKLKLPKPESPNVNVNTPIKIDIKSKSLVTRSQVKRSLVSVKGKSTAIQIKRRRKS